MSGTLSATETATNLIQHYESCQQKLPDGSIVPYLDPRRIPTIGWGNTFWQSGVAVTMSDPSISQAEADDLFSYWLGRFSNDVAPLVPGAAANELAAFVSLAYNIGVDEFKTSTALQDFTQNNKAGAAAGIEMWDRSGGVVLKGLQRRRRAERYVFQGRAVADAISQAQQDFP